MDNSNRELITRITILIRRIEVRKVKEGPYAITKYYAGPHPQYPDNTIPKPDESISKTDESISRTDNPSYKPN